MQLYFDMFSTLMSLEDRLRLKLKVKINNMYGYNAGLPMAIPIYTVLLYCVMTFFNAAVIVYVSICIVNVCKHCLGCIYYCVSGSEPT